MLNQGVINRLFIAFLLLSVHAQQARSDNFEVQSESIRHPKECLSKVNYSQTLPPFKSILQDKQAKFLTATWLLENADKNKARVCDLLLTSEISAVFQRKDLHLKFPEHCLVTSYGQITSERKLSGISQTMMNLAEKNRLKSYCEGSLTAKNVIEGNAGYADLFATLANRDAVNADITAKQAMVQQEADRLAQTDRNFSIKGIGLGETKQSITKIGSPQKFWKCKTFAEYGDYEVCTLRFIEKVCMPIIIDHPTLGPIESQKCSYSRFAEGAPAEVKNLSTLGGSDVRDVSASFYKGKAMEINFAIVSATPELIDAIENRYGSANSKPNNVERIWNAPNEILHLTPELLKLKNIGVTEQLNSDMKYKDDLTRKAKAQKAQQESSNRLKDF